MQTGQVSIWVPIVVGLIGVIGVISGQLVNAWREDRRLRLEQAREEIRWQQENRAHWRDKRFEIYNGLLEFARDYVEHVGNYSVRMVLHDGIPEKDADHIMELLKGVDSFEHRIILVSARNSNRDRLLRALKELRDYGQQVLEVGTSTRPESVE